MTPVDLIAFAGTGMGYLRGRKQGVGYGLYRTLMLAIPLVAGCGLFSLVTQVLEVVPGYKAREAGFIPFVGIMVGTWVLMRTLRSTLRNHLELKFPKGKKSQVAGLIGMGRYGLFIFGLLIGIELSPVDFLTKGTLVDKMMNSLFSFKG